MSDSMNPTTDDFASMFEAAIEASPMQEGKVARPIGELGEISKSRDVFLPLVFCPVSVYSGSDILEGNLKCSNNMQSSSDLDCHWA